MSLCIASKADKMLKVAALERVSFFQVQPETFVGKAHHSPKEKQNVSLLLVCGGSGWHASAPQSIFSMCLSHNDCFVLWMRGAW